MVTGLLLHWSTCMHNHQWRPCIMVSQHSKYYLSRPGDKYQIVKYSSLWPPCNIARVVTDRVEHSSSPPPTAQAYL